MIETYNITKSFTNIKAVDNITSTIKEGSVFGLIGTNGAGKSTFLRMLAGILKPDTGLITIDGIEVFENMEAKKKFFYISDEQYFFSNSTPVDMMKYYKMLYEHFDDKRFYDYLQRFELQKDRKINTFSKGMKKQLSIIYGICSGTKYLFCDETFDGLDPVMRQGVKSIFAGEMESRDFTPVIASHNLRELEDICDHIGLLHKGGILLSKDLIDLKGNIHKVQCVLENRDIEAEILTGLNVLKTEHRGSLITLTVKGEREEIMNKIAIGNPIFLEVLPLSLEEIFISETGVVGYDIKKLIF
ncbi:MAG: ABC transporter ATP-binding protein [Lachnospiraceae bacterium]|nr:ABC transporter ATP-binding protein [Lachnospiraceae bacterium]